MKTATYLRELLAICNMKPIKPDENHEQAEATAQATRPPARTSSHASLATLCGTDRLHYIHQMQESYEAPTSRPAMTEHMTNTGHDIKFNNTWCIQVLGSPKEAFAAAMQSWRECCEKCVCLQGDYVEK